MVEPLGFTGFSCGGSSQKTLGQIAFEACGNSFVQWEVVRERYKQEWEAVGAAVAAAVKEEDARICEARIGTGTAGNCENFDQEASDCAAAIRASIKEVK